MASAAEAAAAAVASPPLCASTDAKRFLELISSKFEWDDLSDDIVMDIGCGNPKIKFCDLLLGLFPKVKKVIAIDKKSHLIAYIKCGKKDPKIDFEYGDIEDRSNSACGNQAVANWASVRPGRCPVGLSDFYHHGRFFLANSPLSPSDHNQELTCPESWVDPDFSKDLSCSGAQAPHLGMVWKLGKWRAIRVSS
ncbi:uncharacterized protein TNCV_1974141 [Trichonephila clavipes]|nr:uncharacterized protein TNCV_1974141 [Trichonephila clavipes]